MRDQVSGQGKNVRVELPSNLRVLSGAPPEITVALEGCVSLRSVLDAVEAQYPALRGTIRDHATGRRRAFMRFFACMEDLSHMDPEAALPDAVAEGREPLLVVGAIAGG